MPHQVDQRERFLGLRALLLQISGHCHQHQEPVTGELQEQRAEMFSDQIFLCENSSLELMEGKGKALTHKYCMCILP